MGAVKIWIGPSKKHSNTLEINVDGKEPYLITPYADIDLHHVVDWLVKELQLDNVEVIDGWKK